MKKPLLLPICILTVLIISACSTPSESESVSSETESESVASQSSSEQAESSSSSSSSTVPKESSSSYSSSTDSVPEVQSEEIDTPVLNPSIGDPPSESELAEMEIEYQQDRRRYLEELVANLSEQEKIAILSGTEEMLDVYKANKGIYPWGDRFTAGFPSFPKDGVYPDINTGEFAIGSVESYNEDVPDHDVQLHLEAGKYKMVFSASQGRGPDWSVHDVRIFVKATGEEIEAPKPKHIREQWSKFNDYLSENLNKEHYTYFDVTSSDEDPIIMYVEGFEEQIDTVISNYGGVFIETNLESGKYSREQLEEYLSEIENSDIVKENYEKDLKKISGIWIADDKIYVGLLEEFPELLTFLEIYPDEILLVKMVPKWNPAT